MAARIARANNLSGNIGLGARTALLEELADLDAQKAKAAQKRGRLLLEDAKARLQAAGIQNVETKLRNDDLVETVLEFEADTDMRSARRRQGANPDQGMGSEGPGACHPDHHTTVA